MSTRYPISTLYLMISFIVIFLTLLLFFSFLFVEPGRFEPSQTSCDESDFVVQQAGTNNNPIVIIQDLPDNLVSIPKVSYTSTDTGCLQQIQYMQDDISVQIKLYIGSPSIHELQNPENDWQCYEPRPIGPEVGRMRSICDGILSNQEIQFAVSIYSQYSKEDTEAIARSLTFNV